MDHLFLKMKGTIVYTFISMIKNKFKKNFLPLSVFRIKLFSPEVKAKNEHKNLKKKN